MNGVIVILPSCGLCSNNQDKHLFKKSHKETYEACIFFLMLPLASRWCFSALVNQSVLPVSRIEFQ